MRKYILIILSLLAMTAAAQVQQRGIVKEYKGKDAKTSLGGVEVAVSRAGKTVTTGDGSFTLTFNTLKPGQRVSVIRIEKAGYEIFNKEALEQWNINPEEPFTIVLCKSDEFRKLRDRYSEVSSASYAKQKAKEEARLAERLKKGELEVERYRQEMARLQTDYESRLDNIEEYADRFARIDLSEVSDTEREIVALVEQGDLDGAIAKYEEQDFLGKYAKMAEAHQVAALVEKKTAMARDSMMAALDRQCDIYRMAGGAENFAKIKALLKNAVLADTTNVKMMLKYAAFCSLEQDDHHEAGIYYDKSRMAATDIMDIMESAHGLTRYAYYNSDSLIAISAHAIKAALPAYRKDSSVVLLNKIMQSYNDIYMILHDRKGDTDGWDIYVDDADKYANLLQAGNFELFFEEMARHLFYNDDYWRYKDSIKSREAFERLTNFVEYARHHEQEVYAACLYYMSATYTFRLPGDSVNAKSYYLKAADVAREFLERNPLSKKSKVNDLLNLSYIFYEAEEYHLDDTLTEQLLVRGVEVTEHAFRTNPYSSIYAYTEALTTYGGFLVEKGRYGDAKVYLDRVAEICRDSKEKYDKDYDNLYCDVSALTHVVISKMQDEQTALSHSREAMRTYLDNVILADDDSLRGYLQSKILELADNCSGHYRDAKAVQYRKIASDNINR